ncbi:hypothetical protein [Pseudoalteromonas prydzensis]|uniref:hypothetical protein n=1 Tax=Pseudoalteromonas prydzensis TaxID=182141 RepID=UPI0007E4EDFC|nr:hypothetical protein [Pseudoalteromonas prydzensis]MBE0377567.1 hypothetical protein [Pseudoalteromonas prydzensis ACAM 620]
MSKHIWDITINDLSEHSVWQFLMWKDNSCDETIIAPASGKDALNSNSNIIVKAKFIDAIGSEFLGFINYGLTEIEYSQPCMFVKDEVVNFWFGISKPSKVDLIKLNFPIVATSVPAYGLESKSVNIDGYGYINENSSICVMLR